MINAGAKISIGTYIAQYRAYGKENLRPSAQEFTDIGSSSSKIPQGFAVSESTIGHADTSVPIARLGIAPTIRSHIFGPDCPSFRCLRDMQRLGLYISIQEHCLILVSKRPFKNNLFCSNGFQTIKSYSRLESFANCTFLLGIHLPRGLLQRAIPDSPSVRYELEKIVTECLTWAKHFPESKTFKLTVGADEYRFYRILAFDIERTVYTFLKNELISAKQQLWHLWSQSKENYTQV